MIGFQAHEKATIATLNFIEDRPFTLKVLMEHEFLNIITLTWSCADQNVLNISIEFEQ